MQLRAGVPFSPFLETLAMILVFGEAGCGKSETKTDAKKETVSQTVESETTVEEELFSNAVKIELSNSEILVNGEKISEEIVG